MAEASRRPAQPPVPAPVVAPEVYDEDYFRHGCAGSAEWSSSEGRQVADIYPGMLRAAGFAPGEVVVDIGTGRGELLVVAAHWGAAEAVGVEYSPAAVRLAEQTVATHEVGDRARVVQADARAVPLPDGYADLVLFVDVVEHLAPAELDAALREALRILRPGGRVHIHTFPSRTMYDVTYRLLRRLALRRSWPADPRNEYERLMHVNEQTLQSMTAALTDAGFTHVSVSPGAWAYTDHLPDRWAQRVVRVLARFRPTARFGIADIVATGRRA
jgi:cyclopropane fatty-acyl-phospholipid synthase-like methyltransferase